VATDLNQMVWPTGAAAKTAVAIINVVRANNTILIIRVRYRLLRILELYMRFLLLRLHIREDALGQYRER
jgi:hypothetical protein